ncbi:molybdenum cofactor guanylyltransferase [Natribacillus halophilus]|uniref:Probable molybdenum cofactor guanylyltransferase n=1 Tax=Natribacillus halophilus TaxID=549003 RepID=A0A1G8N1J8_9BACI|nr:molybdenum cofactor guanylyltransferase [Natribacillus halophilus]SDI74131.1 molybdenum cofactor guanylyltransferase [Natribacillus halophilus]
MNIVGLLLAGGKSSRYGKQKLFEAYEGRALFQRSIKAMQNAGISSIYIVTNRELAPAFEHPVIIEEEPHGGPLHALHTAMEMLPSDWVQVLAGDLPYVDAPTVETILQTAKAHPSADIILPTTNGRHQPLHAAYHTRCLPILRELVENESSMKALYEAVKTRTLSFSNDHPAFININRPEDWREHHE